MTGHIFISDMHSWSRDGPKGDNYIRTISNCRPKCNNMKCLNFFLIKNGKFKCICKCNNKIFIVIFFSTILIWSIAMISLYRPSKTRWGEWDWFKLLRPGGTYLHPKTEPSLVQIMAYHLFGTTLTANPMLTYCLNSGKQNWHENSEFKHDTAWAYTESRK